MRIKIKGPYTPTYQTPGSSGFDLRAAIDRSIELGPGNRHTIPTGLAFEIPLGFEMQVRGRSGLASNHGIHVHLGTVDSDYRGEVSVVVTNHGKGNFVIGPKDRIAQGVIVPVVRAEFEQVVELEKSDRGKKGFGSTGVK